MTSGDADIAIVGGGIVGLATAYRLTERFPDFKVIVLEKELELSLHQSGRNSGVLHSGIYYKPGTLRATNCRKGKEQMEQFCAREGIAYDICGKVIVAITENEFPQLEKIYARGQENGVHCKLIDKNLLHDIEPHTAGIRAIHVPEAGIVNYKAVVERMAEIVRERGSAVLTDAKVQSINQREQQVEVTHKQGTVNAKYLVNCAGLYSDRVARMGGNTSQTHIVPFRGEFWELTDDAKHLCRGLIYPVPDPRFPFLGVHFTRVIDGSVECGPNAVLAFSREGYHLSDVRVGDLLESITYSGFLRMAARYWKTGLGEMWRSFSKAAFVKKLQRLVPEIQSHHLKPAPAGVRAMAVERNGDLMDDFCIEASGRIVNVLNAPSPAATSSLNVGQLVVDQLVERM